MKNIYYKFGEINTGGNMDTVTLEQIKAHEIIEILSTIIQKSIVKGKGEEED